jgi:hypothetical protein
VSDPTDWKHAEDEVGLEAEGQIAPAAGAAPVLEDSRSGAEFGNEAEPKIPAMVSASGEVKAVAFVLRPGTLQ